MRYATMRAVHTLWVLACLGCTYANGAEKTVLPTQLVRMRAMAAEIGSGPASAVLPGNGFFAWVDKEESEYRVLSAFSLARNALGVPAERIFKAELLFSLTAWERGRAGVRVERLGRPQALTGKDMYAAAGGILLSNAWIAGTHRLDVTDAVKQTMTTATAATSLVIRWSQDNDADAGPEHNVAPHAVSKANPVRISTGSTVQDLRLIVSYLPTAPAHVKAAAQLIPGSGTLVCRPLDTITDHGDISQPSSLASLVAAVGLEPGRILLLKGRYPVRSKLHIPSATVLEFEPGAVLGVEEGATVVLDGLIAAGPWRILDLKGTLNGTTGNETVLPAWFGTIANGRADDTVPLQQAADFACKSGILNLNLGRGHYRITKTLNLTNTRRPGTIRRDGLCMRGSSFQNTCVIGDTGDGHAIIETSGAQWLKLDNFRIGSGKENPSTVGIFAGIPKALPQTQNHVYHVYINLHDDPDANAGKGTIGLWNFAAEEHTYFAVYIHANRPVVLTAFNNWEGKTGAGFYHYRNSYLKLLAIHSLGVTSFSGECFLFCLGGRSPAVTTQCANSVTMANTYIGSAGGAANAAGKWEAGGNGKAEGPAGAACAFDIYGSLVNLNYSGTIEGKAAFARINGELKASRVGVTFGGVRDAGAPALILGPNGQILNSDFRFQLEACQDRPVLAGGKGTAALVNSSIRTNQADRWLGKIPAPVRNNSRNSRIATPGRVLKMHGE